MFVINRRIYYEEGESQQICSWQTVGPFLCKFATCVDNEVLHVRALINIQNYYYRFCFLKNCTSLVPSVYIFYNTWCKTVHFSPEYAKYSSDEDDEDDAVLGEPFVKEREIDEQEIDKVHYYNSLFFWLIKMLHVVHIHVVQVNSVLNLVWANINM